MENIFAPIVWIFSEVLKQLQGIVGSYGLAIIALTVIIKLLLYPLTRRQIKSMAQMAKLQPELKKLQDKYKDKPEVMQRKLMEMYSREGVQPLAGCLPLLMQMPILMAMYYALYNFDYGGNAPSFLWLENLSTPDALYILPILSAATTYLQQKITTVEQTPQMRIMQVIMPLFILWISLQFPSGLVLYWTTMNVMQIIQQLWLRRMEKVN